MKQYWLVCIFLLGFYLTKAQSADELFRQERYQEAVIAYELEYYLSSQDSSLLKKAWSYKAMGAYDEAIQNLKRIRQLDVSYELALLYYLNHQLAQSNASLLKMGLSMSDTTINAVLLRALVLIDQYEMGAAKNHLIANASLLGLSMDDIDLIFPRKLKVKNPEKAYNISLIAPGFGQAYAGYPGRGFVSGAMQLGTVGFTYWSLINRYYFSGVLTGAALFYTFYLGGARYAGMLADEKNQEFAKRTKSLLLEKIKKPE